MISQFPKCRTSIRLLVPSNHNKKTEPSPCFLIITTNPIAVHLGGEAIGMVRWSASSLLPSTSVSQDHHPLQQQAKTTRSSSLKRQLQQQQGQHQRRSFFSLHFSEKLHERFLQIISGGSETESSTDSGPRPPLPMLHPLASSSQRALSVATKQTRKSIPVMVSMREPSASVEVPSSTPISS